MTVIGIGDPLAPYVRPGITLELRDGLPMVPMLELSPDAYANAFYFGHPEWMSVWLRYVHRYPELRQRWHAVAGSWDDQVVVDVGCGPGNLFATLGGSPKALIGIDIAAGSLHMARELGYLPLLADAHDVPLIDGFADVVAINGSLHHMEHMGPALAEAARLVRPGGVLVVDHDPQRSAWNFRGLGRLLWELRRPIYRALNRGGHRTEHDEGLWARRSELHHKPGDGLTEHLLRDTLEPLGFDLSIYPHNNRIGAELLDGERGVPPLQIRIGQLLSGIRSSHPAGAVSLMCVARLSRSGAINGQ
jgi:SAM-dependent methyltransferase